MVLLLQFVTCLLVIVASKDKVHKRTGSSVKHARPVKPPDHSKTLNAKLAKVSQGLSATERADYHQKAMLRNDRSATTEEPVALYIVGPSASGKSYAMHEFCDKATDGKIKRTDDGDKKCDAALVDGDQARQASKSLEDLIAFVRSHNLKLKNVYEKNVKGWSSKEKKDVFDQAVQNAQSVIIPTTLAAINAVNDLQKKMKSLVKKGYKIYVLFVFSDFDKTCAKGVERARGSGKDYDGAAYGITMQHGVRATRLPEVTKAMAYHNLYDGGNVVELYKLDGLTKRLIKTWKDMSGVCPGSLSGTAALAAQTARVKAHKTREMVSGLSMRNVMKLNRIHPKPME